MASNSSSDEPPILSLLQAVSLQLDALIRGRKVDLVSLHATGCALLARSFGEGEPSEREQLVSTGTKIHNILRSPRFSQQEAFSLIRAAVSNVISLKEDTSSSGIVSVVRCHARSAQELGRLPGHIDGALRVVGNLERHWASLDANQIAGLPPAELKECQSLVLSSLIMKSDLFSATGRPGDAVECLRALEQQGRLTEDLPNAPLALASKAFKFGQHVLVQREATANGATTADGPQLGKGAAAAVCFEAALDLLAKYPALEPGDQRSQSQQRPEADILALKAKCLTQLALAHHLEGRHDDALACLDGVPLDSALRSISQELRFGILLAARRMDEAHRCVHDLIRQTTADCEAFRQNPMRLGEAPDCALLLKWLRRIGTATHFDSTTLQHYTDLQTKWQDDERNLEVRLQLIAGLLIEGQCPSPPPTEMSVLSKQTLTLPATSTSSSSSSSPSSTSISPLTSRGLRFCDDILNDHRARQRLLSATHFSRIEATLKAALNAAQQQQHQQQQQAGEATSPATVVAVAERLVRCLELETVSQAPGIKFSTTHRATDGGSSSVLDPRKYVLLGAVLAMQAEALLTLGRLPEAMATATRSFDCSEPAPLPSTTPSSTSPHDGAGPLEGTSFVAAFAVKFRCALLGAHPERDGCAELDTLQERAAAFKKKSIPGADGGGGGGTVGGGSASNELASIAAMNGLYQAAAILAGMSPLDHLGKLEPDCEPKPLEGGGEGSRDNAPSNNIGSASALSILELEVAKRFVRAFQHAATTSPSFSSRACSLLPEACPSFAAFLLRAFVITCDVAPILPESLPTASSLLTPIAKAVSTLFTSTSELLVGAYFLVEKTRNLGVGSNATALTQDCDGAVGNTNTMSPFGSSQEFDQLGSACWNLAVLIRQRGFNRLHSSNVSPTIDRASPVSSSNDSAGAEVSGSGVTTKLFIAAFDLQKASDYHNGETCIGRRRTRNEDEEDKSGNVSGTKAQCSDKGALPSNKKMRIVNKVGMLTMAASDVVDRYLVRPPLAAASSIATAQKATPGFPLGASAGTSKEPELERTRQLRSALSWMHEAQNDARRSLALIGENDSQGDIAVGGEDDSHALKGMLVTISMLRLISGLHGFIYAPPQKEDGSTADKPSTSASTTSPEVGVVEDAGCNNGASLLALVSECSSELQLVPADTLRAAASSAKSLSHCSTAHALLRIAVDSQRTLLSQLSGQERCVVNVDDTNDDGASTLSSSDLETAQQTMVRLHCDLFHVAPSADSCLREADEVLGLLDTALKPNKTQAFDEAAVEGLVSQCYNWGLQGLSLGSVGAGASSERLIGKAQQLLRHCPGLSHYESDITQAYQRALEVKEEEHESLVQHARLVDLP